MEKTKYFLLILLIGIFFSGCEDLETGIIIHNFEEANNLYSDNFNVIFNNLIETDNRSSCTIYYYNVSFIEINRTQKLYTSVCDNYYYYDTPGLISHKIYNNGTIEEVQDYD